MTKLSRLLPDDYYGRNPYRPEIVATKLESMTGFGRCLGADFFGHPVYPQAKLSVLLEHVPFDLKDDGEIAASGGSEFERYTYFGDAQGSSQNITVPGGSMRFWRPPGTGTTAPHGVPVPYGISVTRAEEEFSYHWCKLPQKAFIPTSNLYERVYGNTEGALSWMGCVNTVPIFDRPGGTVVFTGVTPVLQRAHIGDGRRWSLQYKFAYSSYGWNWLYFAGTPGTGGVLEGAGWYNVNTTGYHTADTLQDHTSLSPGARDLNQLFSVAAA